jgi:hypothetical protein
MDLNKKDYIDERNVNLGWSCERTIWTWNSYYSCMENFGRMEEKNVV